MTTLHFSGPGSDLMISPRSMDRLFERFFGYGAITQEDGTPTYALPVDILETEDAYVLHATVAGVPQDGAEVTFEGGMLTIAVKAVPVQLEGKLIRQERPAIILLDLVVPRAAPKPGDISFHEPVGLSILRAIKKDPQTKAARVIIFSNLDADEHKQKAKALGAEAYLIKANVPPHALTDFISGFLKQT